MLLLTPRDCRGSREVACMNTSKSNLLPRFPAEKLGRRFVKWEGWYTQQLPQNSFYVGTTLLVLHWEIRVSDELSEEDWATFTQGGVDIGEDFKESLEFVSPPKELGRVTTYRFRTYRVEVTFSPDRWEEAVAYFSHIIADGSVLERELEMRLVSPKYYTLPPKPAEDAKG